MTTKPTVAGIREALEAYDAAYSAASNLSPDASTEEQAKVAIQCDYSRGRLHRLVTPDYLRALLTVAEAAVDLMSHRGVQVIIQSWAIPINQIATDATGDQLEAMVKFKDHAKAFLDALEALE